MSDPVFYCGARTKSCRVCGHRFTKEEYDLWTCPECGEDRHCRRKVTREGERCRYHGGASLKGAAAPAFRTGRYSKYLPTHLLDRYNTAQADTELLSLREEVALLDTRLTSLVEGLSTGESVGTWEVLGATHEQLMAARRSGDAAAMARALIRIGELIERGQNEGEQWNVIVTLLDQRRKLVESERKRLVELQQVITAERAMALITAIVHVVSRHVTDRGVLNAIAIDVRQLVDQPGG